jgi:hypothetical protein
MTLFGALDEYVVEVGCLGSLGGVIFPTINFKTEGRTSYLELFANGTYQ